MIRLISRTNLISYARPSACVPFFCLRQPKEILSAPMKKPPTTSGAEAGSKVPMVKIPQQPSSTQKLQTKATTFLCRVFFNTTNLVQMPKPSTKILLWSIVLAILQYILAYKLIPKNITVGHDHIVFVDSEDKLFSFGSNVHGQFDDFFSFF